MGVNLVVVGGGRMGEALVVGLMVAGQTDPTSIAVVELDAGRRAELTGADGIAPRFPGLSVVASVPDIAADPGFGAVIAVKPADVASACRALAAAAPARVLSIAAGVTLAALRTAFTTSGPALLRAMPNTPALVGAGAAGLAAAPEVGPEDLRWAEGILGAVGLVLQVSEDQLDAVTGLSGSGPAYLFLVAEALIDGGVLVGLPRPVAQALTTQTLLGAARMLSEGDEGPEALRAAVTSPAGTTAAGLRALESAGVRGALIDAVVAATERSRQLGS